MLPSFATDTIHVVTPVWVDDRGTMVPDWSQPPASRTPVYGCSVQPGASTEDLLGRQNVTVRWTVWAPEGTVVDAHQGVEWQGVVYQVDGEPLSWRSPSGAVSHVVLLLVDWQG